LEVSILLAPQDTPSALAILSDLKKTGVASYALKLQPHWESETQQPLEFRMKRATHILLMLSGASANSTWFSFAAGWCLGGRRDLALFRSDRSIPVPGYLSGVPILDSDDAITLFYETQRAEWLVKEERDNARDALMESGIPFRSESLADCCREGDVKSVGFFLKAGMIPDMRDKAGVPLLGLAIRNKHSAVAELLVSRGASIDFQSEDRGYSALMDAASGGSLELVDLLLKRGANPDLVSKDGQSALIISVGRNDVPLCRKLLDYGANPDLTDKLGFSARKYAALFHNQQMLELFK
jgi:uncharacterized protein